jgi:hypothetical protein
MGGVQEISSSFFKVSSFKVKVCGRELFDSLKVWGVWKKALWVVETKVKRRLGLGFGGG